MRQTEKFECGKYLMLRPVLQLFKAGVSDDLKQKNST